jgi:hypothetical protein
MSSPSWDLRVLPIADILYEVEHYNTMPRGIKTAVPRVIVVGFESNRITLLTASFIASH